jgi:site-specific DNA-methyltransferase (cytosine-N4-specific)
VRSTDHFVPRQNTATTRLSRIHPYPAMVPDELALALAERHVRPGFSILDPFCGSGRLLAAVAFEPVFCVGTDLNPLACLLTRAKFAPADPAVVETVVRDLESARQRPPSRSIELRARTKVDWFAPVVILQLSQIITWINELRLADPEKLVIAAAFSAAARDASFVRKDGWKLHRLAQESRDSLSGSAWEYFARRLQYCLREISAAPRPSARAQVDLADARNLYETMLGDVRAASFDVVVTSPPYGDSRTTVQYGAASALLLDLVSRIDGLEEYFMPGAQIDARCLGGSFRSNNAMPADDIRPYWAGSGTSPKAKSVGQFLGDFGRVCAGIASCLKPGGTATLIIGCRSTGGYRLRLDRFTTVRLEFLGLKLVRFARCASATQRAKGLTRTMAEEIVLTFEKPREP